MQDPKIIPTKTTRSPIAGPPPKSRPFGASNAEGAGAGFAGGVSTSRPDAARRPLYAHPVMLGLLFIGAGCFVWSLLSEKVAPVPKAWQTNGAPSAPDAGLHTSVRSAGPEQGELLRLEWPAHPKAESYLVRFRGPNSYETAAIPVLGSIFLYDLKSDVFNLPDSFQWTATAVMADGTQVTGPPASYSLKR